MSSEKTLRCASRRYRFNAFFASPSIAPQSLRDSSPGERAHPQRRAFAESGAANAVFLYVPSHEKGFQESPRLRSNESPSGAFKRRSGLR